VPISSGSVPESLWKCSREWYVCTSSKGVVIQLVTKQGSKNGTHDHHLPVKGWLVILDK
jgi:hypothetical protein